MYYILLKSEYDAMPDIKARYVAPRTSVDGSQVLIHLRVDASEDEKKNLAGFSAMTYEEILVLMESPVWLNLGSIGEKKA